MTEFIRTWVLGLAAAGMLGAVAMAVTPKGRTRAVVGLVCALVTIVAFIGPIVSFDYVAHARYLREYELALDMRMDDIDRSQERLTSLIISERTETYILDKAERLDMEDMNVQVEIANRGEGVFYPYAVWLEGTYSDQQKHTLAAYLTEILGIPPERQYWSDIDEQ